MVNKPNLLSIPASFLQIKLWKSKLEGQMHPDSGKLWFVTKHSGRLQFDHSLSFNWGKRSKNLLEWSTSWICWPFKHPFSRKKLCKSKLEGEMHPDRKIKVSCDMNQSTFGTFNWNKRSKICINGQQAEFVDRLSILSQIKHRKSELEGEMHPDVKIQVSNY